MEVKQASRQEYLYTESHISAGCIVGVHLETFLGPQACCSKVFGKIAELIRMCLEGRLQLGGDLGGSYRRDLLENLSTPLLFRVDSEMGGAEEY